MPEPRDISDDDTQRGPTTGAQTGKDANVGHTPAQAEGDESTVDQALEKQEESGGESGA